MRKVILEGTPRMPGFKHASTRPDRRDRRVHQNSPGAGTRSRFGGASRRRPAPSCPAASVRKLLA